MLFVPRVRTHINLNHHLSIHYLWYTNQQHLMVVKCSCQYLLKIIFGNHENLLSVWSEHPKLSKFNGKNDISLFPVHIFQHMHLTWIHHIFTSTAKREIKIVQNINAITVLNITVNLWVYLPTLSPSNRGIRSFPGKVVAIIYNWVNNHYITIYTTLKRIWVQLGQKFIQFQAMERMFLLHLILTEPKGVGKQGIFYW